MNRQCLIVFLLHGLAVFGQHIIPLGLDEAIQSQLYQGDVSYVEVHYYDNPHEDAVFIEPGEQVWWIRDRGFLMLGATGSDLPREVLVRKRACWIPSMRTPITFVLILAPGE